MALRSGYYGLKTKILNKVNKWDQIVFPRSEQAVLGARNLNLTKYSSGAISGITWVVNADGSVTGNGTVEGSQSDNAANTNASFIAPFTGMVKCSGGVDVNLCTFPFDWTENSRPYTDATKTTKVGDQYSRPITFYMEAGHKYTLIIRAKSGKVLDNTTIYPQIIVDSDDVLNYTAPAMTNQELTVSAADQKTTINAIITAATGAADFAAFKTAMGAITPVTRSLSKEASPEDVPEEVIEEEKPVTKKTTKKTTVKEGE